MQGEEPKELWRALLHREPENDQVWRPWVGHQFGEAADTFRRSGEWLGQNHVILRGYPELVAQYQQQTQVLNALRETEALDKQQKADVEAQLQQARLALAAANKNLQAMQASAAATQENTNVLKRIASALHIPGF